MGEGEGEEDRAIGCIMTPWEQHSTVISIPRFDYSAPSSLLHHSHSGFLITCTIKREKSATKEAMSILEKYVGSFYTGSSENFGCSDANEAPKRRKICTVKTDGEYTNCVQSKTVTDDFGNTGELSKNTCLSAAKADANADRDLLSLVKLTRSGLVLFTFPRNNVHDTVDIVLNIIQSLESGSLKSPLWCHRILPIQATCNLNEKELQAVASHLVVQFVNKRRDKLVHPIKFAVGYNRRGIEETEIKSLKNIFVDPNLFSLLDRNKCFSIVAAAVKESIPDSVVDLKSPELSILVELLPLAGVPNGSLVVAVSVLPHNLVCTKPRLCVKALVSKAKANDRTN
ncbi:uncharacterized protein LOC131153511 isoform X2 [Malania oleifera]|uniref:uncharacterized protein LOC131153511 isoform X2 n=1 Tax=Malania oleifera TaxID=397392 RepID=UPI0025AEAE5F|nr:uncharacterized protein LOC131153511 isoform X2 [Malania oleifera]